MLVKCVDFEDRVTLPHFVSRLDLVSWGKVQITVRNRPDDNPSIQSRFVFLERAKNVSKRANLFTFQRTKRLVKMFSEFSAAKASAWMMRFRAVLSSFPRGSTSGSQTGSNCERSQPIF